MTNISLSGLSGRIEFISNAKESGNNTFRNIWLNTAANEDVEKLFTEFKDDVKVVESSGAMNGSRQLGSVTITPEGKIRITSGGTHVQLASKGDDITFDLTFGIKGEKVGNTVYNNNGFHVNNVVNKRIAELELQAEQEITMEVLRNRARAKMLVK